jgi:hypothetical protein
MRHLLLALMIALLPVRGWVGNAMAVDMASQQVVMAQSMAQDAAMNAESAMPADCPMHAQAAADESSDANQKTGAGTHCNGCNTCELCLALASFTWADPPTSPFTPHAAPLSQGTRFSSADSVSSLKPPSS